MLMAWLFLSHGLTVALGGLALESRSHWLAAALLCGVPAWRVYRRFRSARGYYVLGHGSDAGGDPWYRGGWVSHGAQRAHFTLCLALELFVIGFLTLSVLHKVFIGP
jgi:hypothetical protein